MVLIGIGIAISAAVVIGVVVLAHVFPPMFLPW